MKYNGNNLKDVLEAHKRWLNKVDGWTTDDRACFIDADLRGACLRHASLRGACLIDADLSNADLRGANLSRASLGGARLIDADLSNVDLKGASLIDAYLSHADFSSADLRGACLRHASLRGACLIDANLINADLSGADLRGACLRGARLIDADLNYACLINADFRRTCLIDANLIDAINVPYVPMACPDSGAFVGWKKCRAHGKNNDVVIVKLLIPEDAKRCSSTGRKCRTDKAVVLEIQNPDGTKADNDVAYSAYKNQHFAYKIGETVFPEKMFEDDRWRECASGIHFFINRQEAVDYLT